MLKAMKQELLQPVDILVCLKLAMDGSERKSYKQLEQETSIHAATLHRAVTRAQQAKLIRADRQVNRRALIDFLQGGIQYAFYTSLGAPTRGIPTAYATSPLADVMTPSEDLPPVWPDALGNTRGYAITPLHPNASKIAKQDVSLYEQLALVDAIRIGNAREKHQALQLLEQRLIVA